jgi:nicotinamide mononucleotide transporter
VTIELFAVLFGVLAVYLSTRENIWSWPTGIVNVSLYFVVFLRARLYAGAGLQVVYLLLAIYGWYEWQRGGSRRPRLTVTRAAPRLLLLLLFVNLATWLALGTLLRRETNATLPYLDSLLTSTSLIAQALLTRKKLETWLLWIAVDLVYVPMYLSQRLFLTAGLYAIFLALAVLGLRDWRRSMHRARAAPDDPAAER